MSLVTYCLASKAKPSLLSLSFKQSPKIALLLPSIFQSLRP